MSPYRDTHDASRLVLHDLIWQLPVRGKHVAAIPNRNVLIVTGDEDVDNLEAMAALTRQVLTEPRAMTGTVFRLDGTAWHPFLPPADSSAHWPLRSIAMESTARDYAEQKEALERLHAATGADVFVAKQTLMRREDSSLYTCAVWVEDVTDGLLPHADSVSLGGVRDGQQVNLGFALWGRPPSGGRASDGADRPVPAPMARPIVPFGRRVERHHLDRGADVTDQWDAKLYDGRHAFVHQLAAGVVDLLAPQPGERVLDLGCGTGALTQQIADAGADVFGIDASPAMVAKATAAYPGLSFAVADATTMVFDQPFDAVFSNAVLHWVRPPAAAVARMFAALRPGGRLVLEMGGRGNVATVLAAAAAAGRDVGLDLSRRWTSTTSRPSARTRRCWRPAGSPSTWRCCSTGRRHCSATRGCGLAPHVSPRGRRGRAGR